MTTYTNCDHGTDPKTLTTCNECEGTGEVPTFWNGEPTPARKVTLVVADSEAPRYWARSFVGTRRDAVEIEYGGETFYIDDGEIPARGMSDTRSAGAGWGKVTIGRGSPRYGHGSLSPVPGTVEART